MNTKRTGLIACMMLAMLLMIPPVSAEILNDDEYGSIEIIDFSVIEEAADNFSPVGLSFNVSRGGGLYPGDNVTIYFRGHHDKYVSILDFSPDRKVKPLVINEYTSLAEGGLERAYYSTVGDVTGREYVMLIVTELPVTDARLEEIALAPNEVELDEDILAVAINDFRVVPFGRNPNRVVEWGESLRPGMREGEFIELEDVALFLDYPLNTYPYNPWPYMHLYPRPIFRPRAYTERYGPFSRTWYVFPTGRKLESNFWDYATTGWIERGRWIIPPGGYWEGTFRADNPYADYLLRILPYTVRENNAYADLQVEINGTLVESSIDISGAIGWGEYWTSDPFAYYSLYNLLREGENTLTIYWPEDREENLELQMVDVQPEEVAEEEIEEAREAAADIVAAEEEEEENSTE